MCAGARGSETLGVPTGATFANIDTVTPNATVVGTAGATALVLTVGNSGMGIALARGADLRILWVYTVGSLCTASLAFAPPSTRARDVP